MLRTYIDVCTHRNAVEYNLFNWLNISCRIVRLKLRALVNVRFSNENLKSQSMLHFSIITILLFTIEVTFSGLLSDVVDTFNFRKIEDGSGEYNFQSVPCERLKIKSVKTR